MNPAARERLDAMSPDEQRAERARLMEIIWTPTEARRGLTLELGIASRTASRMISRMASSLSLTTASRAVMRSLLTPSAFQNASRSSSGLMALGFDQVAAGDVQRARRVHRHRCDRRA